MRNCLTPCVPCLLKSSGQLPPFLPFQFSKQISNVRCFLVVSAPFLGFLLFIAATEGHWSCCSGSHQRQKSQINSISRQGNDHQALSFPPVGHWMRLKLQQQPNRGFASPRQKVHMVFMEKLEHEHGWTHCCSLHL